MSKKKKVAKNMEDSSFNLDPVVDENAVVNEDVLSVVEDAIDLPAEDAVAPVEEKKKKKKGFLWIILILLLCVGAYFGYDYWNKNKPVKPTTTLTSNEVTITAGDTYNPESNIKVGEGDTYQISTDLNTTKEGTYTVNVKIFSSSGVEDNKSFTVKVNAPKSEKGCELVYVVDTPETTEKKWIIDKPGKAAVTKQKYVKDKDEVKEVSHYEDVWVDDKGHYEKVLIKEAVPEQGHYETVHHEAVTHQEPIYGLVHYADFYKVENNVEVWRKKGYKRDASGGINGMTLGEFCRSMDGSGWVVYSKDEIVDYKTVVDKEAWDEQVWKVDKAAEPAVYEDKWVVDVPGHYEKKKIIDVPYQKEQGHYETIIITPAVEEVGHWETVTVPEQGHYEERKGC